MRTFIRTIETLELDGGALCLNFVNTVKSRFEDPLFEFIVTPADMLLWTCRVPICDEDSKGRINNYVDNNKGKAITELKKILEIRELLYRIFHQLSQKKRPAEKDIRHFNEILSKTFIFMKLEINENIETKIICGYEPVDLLWAIPPIVKSAYELLISEAINRIKECPNCGWLYLDKSKNNSRLWCNMKTCGNTIKIKKYYEKNKRLINKLKS